MESHIRDREIEHSTRMALEDFISLDASQLNRSLLSGELGKALVKAVKKANAEEIPREGDATYSGMQPHVYVGLHTSEANAIAQASRCLWLLAKELYINPEHDRADLSAWLDDGVPFSLQRSSKHALIRLSQREEAIPLYSREQGHLVALTSLRKLNSEIG